MNPENYTEVILNPDGKVFRRAVSSVEVALNERSLIASLQESMSLTLRDAFLLEKRWVSLLLSTSGPSITAFATIAMPYLHLNAPFRVLEDGKVTVPVFEPAGSDRPVFTVDWDVATATAGKARCWLLVHAAAAGPDSSWGLGECWLCLTSSSNRTYRMPMANVYDNCRVCMGEYAKVHTNLFNALRAALTQFEASAWNSDLRKPVDRIESFFRFKQSDSGFETLPCNGQWSNLCERVSVVELEKLVLPAPQGGNE